MANSNQLPEKYYLEHLLAQTKQDPERICHFFLDPKGEVASKLSRQDWVSRASQVATIFRQEGVKAGDRVVLALPTSEAFVVSFLALWWLGAVPVPLPEPSPQMKKAAFSERLLHVIADCSPQLVLLTEQGRSLIDADSTFESMAGAAPLYAWEEMSFKAQSVVKRIDPCHSAGDHAAFIQYTSGSTGNPKGVVVTHGNLMANVHAAGVAAEATGKDSFLSWLPLYHDMGLIGSVLWTNYWNMPVYLMPSLYFLSNPSVWLEAISKYQITLSIAPNFAYSLCARRVKPEQIEGFDLSSWRLAFNGAEPIDAITLQGFAKKFVPFGFDQDAFYPVYGMAEATLAVSFPVPGTPLCVDKVERKALVDENRVVPAAQDDGDPVRFVSVGKVIPGHELLIKAVGRDEILADRQIGEICLRGDSITPYYFHERQFGTEARQELRTGDLGYCADGHLYIVDRLDDLIMIAGANYFPFDLERQVQGIQGIRQGRAVAFGIPDPKTGTTALVIAAEISSSADPGQLKKQIRDKLFAAYGLSPADIFLSSDKIIPLTSSGKIMRKRCRQLYLSQGAKAQPAPSQQAA